MSDDDDDITLSSISDGEEEDNELMRDILQSIATLKKLPSYSGIASNEIKAEKTDAAPVDLDTLSLIELNVYLDQVEKALALNSNLQNFLISQEVRLLSIKRHLQNLRPKGRELKDSKDDENKGDVGKYIVSFKAPYFKNADNFASYVIVPEKQLPFSASRYFDRAIPWTKVDLKDLEQGIKSFLMRRSFQVMMKRKPKNTSEKQKILNRYSQLGKSELNKLIDSDFDEIVDWCNIASRLRKNHSPYECQKAWEIFLKPSINKKKWNIKELEKLKKCALERSYEDWDAIAEDLGTGRSGYQCFYEYQEAIMKIQEGEWSKSEEDFLVKLVKECSYGEKILWHKVAYYFESRSHAQLYRKWNLSAVGKTNVTGRFTEEEDQMIIDTLIMNPGDFNRVSRTMNRLGSQLRYRCAQLKNALQYRYGAWTLEEDQQLLDLVQKYGVKRWAKIAENIPSRSRVQCRQRHYHLKKIVKLNSDTKLEELPRPNRPSFVTRKQLNIKYVLDKKMKSDQKASEGEDVIGVDTAKGPIILNKDDVEEIAVDKKRKWSKKKKMWRNMKKQNLSNETDRKTIDYYSSLSEYIGDPLKPSDVCNGEQDVEITNAVFKFKPYKYFNHENADWWYNADRSDPYYKEVINYLDKHDVKVNKEVTKNNDCNWLLPPSVTTLEGFYNLLVDLDFKPSDLDKSEEEIENDLKQFYCESDEETVRAVEKWEQRLKTMFLWPAVLSEIELDQNEEVAGETTFECSQILNESQMIQLTEDLNLIEDDDLQDVMTQKLEVVEEVDDDRVVKGVKIEVIESTTPNIEETASEIIVNFPELE